MVRVIAVGATSLLRRAAAAASPEIASWRVVAHDRIAPAAFADADCVVNFAFDPRLRLGRYEPAHDVDLAIAAALGGRPVHYVMLSSRMVYGRPERFGIAETAPLAPASPYALAKAETERALGRLLGPRLTILRLANIVAYDAEPERATFMGLVLNRLQAEGRIVFDMSPLVRRDFLPVANFAAALVRLTEARTPGVFNLGSGLPTAAGRIAEWVTAGFGRGELLVTDLRRHDSFSLDVTAAAHAFGLSCGEAELAAACTELGRRLARGERPA